VHLSTSVATFGRSHADPLLSYLMGHQVEGCPQGRGEQDRHSRRRLQDLTSQDRSPTTKPMDEPADTSCMPADNLDDDTSGGSKPILSDFTTPDSGYSPAR
jgi:hypothetical protein